MRAEISRTLSPRNVYTTTSSRGTAHTTPKRDLEAAEGALIRTDPHQFARFDYAVEASPQKAERIVHQCADSRHLGDLVIDPIQHRVDVTGEFSVCLRLGDPAQVKCNFRHG